MKIKMMLIGLFAAGLVLALSKPAVSQDNPCGIICDFNNPCDATICSDVDGSCSTVSGFEASIFNCRKIALPNFANFHVPAQTAPILDCVPEEACTPPSP